MTGRLTKPRARGLAALAGRYPGAGRISNVTDEAVGYVYWQTARWLIENELAFSPGGEPSIMLTPRGVDVANGGAQCRECGCTDNSGCEDGCYWVEDDLCSACAAEEGP